MEFLQMMELLLPVFHGGFWSGSVWAIAISIFNPKASIPLCIWTVFCGLSILIYG